MTELRKYLRFGALSSIMDFLAPPVCPMCEEDIFDESGVCLSCSSRLPQLPERRCPSCGGPLNGILEICDDCADAGPRPWSAAVTAFPFHGPVRLAIHRFKYRNRISLAPFFGRKMAEAWMERGKGGIDAVTYVPLHWMRYMERGYNQAELVAEEVGRHLGVKTMRTMRRIHRTGRQATLGRSGRLENMRGAFAPCHAAGFEGMRLLLVDDVFTTGTTLGEATTTLLNAGAKSVSVLTIARD